MHAELLERVETIEGIQRGLADVKAGRTKSARRCSTDCGGSMAYRVELAKSAEAQLEDLYLWVVERTPSQGAAWFNRLEQAILSLEPTPRRQKAPDLVTRQPSWRNSFPASNMR